MTTSGPSLLRTLSAAVDAADWATALTVLERDWSTLVHDDKQRLWDVLSLIPHSVLDERPEVLRARTFLRTRIVEPRDVDSPLDELAALTDRIVERRRHGETARIAEEVSAARRLLASITDRIAAERLAELRYQWGLALEEAGDSLSALDELVAACEAAERAQADRLRLLSGGRAAFLCALLGETGRAEALLARCAGAGDADGWAGGAAVSATLARSLLLFDRLDEQEARDLLATIDTALVRHRWPSYFLTQAIVEAGPTRSRALATRFEAHLGAQPSDGLNPARLEYVRAIRYIHFAAEKRFRRARAALEDRIVGRESSVVARLSESLHAADLSRTGRAAEADRLRAPLLESIGPRIVLLASVAHPAPTLPDLRAMAHLALGRSILWPLRLLPTDSRAVVVEMLAESGASQAAARLRVERGPESALPVRLTLREHAVAERAANGEKVAAIAAALHVSPNTVKTQLRSVYRRLGVSSRRELFDRLHRLDRHPGTAGDPEPGRDR